MLLFILHVLLLLLPSGIRLKGFLQPKRPRSTVIKNYYNSQIKYYRSLLKTLSVLVEATTENHVITGYSDNYIPALGREFWLLIMEGFFYIYPGRTDRILLGKAIQNQYTV